MTDESDGMDPLVSIDGVTRAFLSDEWPPERDPDTIVRDLVLTYGDGALRALVVRHAEILARDNATMAIARTMGDEDPDACCPVCGSACIECASEMTNSALGPFPNIEEDGDQ